MKRTLFTFIFVLLAFSIVNAQTGSKFNYANQKKLIPAELGKVYLGISLKEFAKQINLKKASVDSRYEAISIDIPLEKGNIQTLTIKVSGLNIDEKKAVLLKETVSKKDEFGENYEEIIERINLDKLSSKGFVYAIYIKYKRDFDLKKYVIKTYGNDGEVRKADDKYNFFDIQWTKKTSDGLDWLIRSFHEGENKSLQLLGRIKDTEWEIEEL